MKMEDLNKKTKVELNKALQDNLKRLRQLRFDLLAGKVKNVKEVRKVKKENARILTLLNTWPKNN